MSSQSRFSVGDKVLVLSPDRDANGNEGVVYGPGWLSDMDMYVGKVCTVRRITNPCGYIKLIEDGGDWSFDPKFLIPMNEQLEESNEEISNFLDAF